MSLLDKIKELASEISARHKYVRGDKGILEKPYVKLKNNRPESRIGKIGRISGLGVIDLSWFLFCLAKFGLKDTKNSLNALLLNNVLIDKLAVKKQNIKLKNDDSKFKQFFKNLQKSNPRAAATLQLWMVYALMVLSLTSGIKISNYKNVDGDDKELLPEEKEHKRDKYNPNDADFVKDFMDDNFEEIVVGLLEFETYRETPVLHPGEKRYTYGPGLTWVYVDGKQHPCSGKYKTMAEGFSDAEIWDQVRQHCVYKTECLPLIKKALVANGFTEISKQQALALFLAGYQLPGSVKGMISKLKAAGNNEQKIIDAFMAGKEVKSQWRNGTNKRRWWCAMLYTGKINIEDFLNMNRDAFSNININKIMRNGHFLYDDETIQYALQCKSSNKGTVREFIVSKDILQDADILYMDQRPKEFVFNEATKNIKSKQLLKNTLTNNNDGYTV